MLSISNGEDILLSKRHVPHHFGSQNTQVGVRGIAGIFLTRCAFDPHFLYKYLDAGFDQAIRLQAQMCPPNPAATSRPLRRIQSLYNLDRFTVPPRPRLRSQTFCEMHTPGPRKIPRQPATLSTLPHHLRSPTGVRYPYNRNSCLFERQARRSFTMAPLNQRSATQSSRRLLYRLQSSLENRI